MNRVARVPLALCAGLVVLWALSWIRPHHQRFPFARDYPDGTWDWVVWSVESSGGELRLRQQTVARSDLADFAPSGPAQLVISYGALALLTALPVTLCAAAVAFARLRPATRPVPRA